MRRGDRSQREDHAGVSAREERARVVSRRGDFLRSTVSKEVEQDSCGSPAKAVAYEVHRMIIVPFKVRDKRLAAVVPAEPFVAALSTVRSSVIDPGTRDLCVHLAGSVPGARVRTDGRHVDIHVPAVKHLSEIRKSQTPVRDLLISLIVLSPAAVAVDHHIRYLCAGRRAKEKESSSCCQADDDCCDAYDCGFFHDGSSCFYIAFLFSIITSEDADPPSAGITFML